MRLHFIAIGGAAMHNLALALHENGHLISGSDDEIMEPSRSRLQAAGLFPQAEGWFPEKITSDIDAVILGMHARAENPELLKAQQLKIPVYSFPDFLYRHAEGKRRVVIGGSHGKTSITGMIMHVLQKHNYEFDYMVGAKLDGFNTMVRLSNAPLIILEGDEYLSSPIDRRPKFHLYKADIGLISGISWDHINVFPTFENYVEQFKIFADHIPSSGTLIYCSADAEVMKVANSTSTSAQKIAYGIPEYRINNGITSVFSNGKEYTLEVFGEHNLMNIEGARHVCNCLGIDNDDFYSAITTFKGAARRLELLGRNSEHVIYRDFAHSPSKLKATIHAVREQFPDKKLVACMELHTFSSLNENFLNQYEGTMDEADKAFVYFNPHTVEHKKLKPVSEKNVKSAFKNEKIEVFTDSKMLSSFLMSSYSEPTVLLLMSSGNFDGLNLTLLTESMLGTQSANASY